MLFAKKSSLLLLVILLLNVLRSETKDLVHFKEAVKVNELYLIQLKSFKNSIYQFEKSSDTSNFLAMRSTYKKCEFLLYYLDSKLSKSINGPNIVTNEYDSLNPNEEFQPHGLQVIESLLYDDSLLTSTLKEEIQLLKSNVEGIEEKHKKASKSDFALLNVIAWDAWRQELFRLEALGLTGFDTPLCKSGLPEAISVLESLGQFVKIYKKSIEKEDYLVITKQIKNAIKYIQKDFDFDHFNRIDFFRNHLHPLNKMVNELRFKLGFKFPSNVKPVDQSADFLYDERFFNATFFNSSSTPERIALGERLFYDTQLSLNNSRSCTSCHDPKLGYADGKVKNTNFSGDSQLLRNTPSLINAGWQTKFFYDSRVKNLEKQALRVIHNPDEMGGDLKMVLEKIKLDPLYVEMFHAAYKDNINESTVVNAIAAYVHSLTSFQSKSDRYLRGEEIELSTQEKEGFNLFTGKAKCATCHFMPLYNGLVPPFYTETESEKIGVPAKKNETTTIDPDLGRYNYTHLSIHRYAFKTPSLRAISVTAPYMHNGVFGSLEEVIEFYNKGGGAGHGMDFPDQTLPSDSLRLTKKEQNSLLEFLKSL